MRNADPRVKLLFIFVSTTLALVFRDVLWLMLLAAAVFPLTSLLGGKTASFLGRFKALLPLLIILMLAQAVFVRSGEPVIFLGDMVIAYSGGLLRGAQAVLRIAVVIFSAAVAASESSRRYIS